MRAGTLSVHELFFIVSRCWDGSGRNGTERDETGVEMGAEDMGGQPAHVKLLTVFRLLLCYIGEVCFVFGQWFECASWGCAPADFFLGRTKVLRAIFIIFVKYCTFDSVCLVCW